MNLVRRIDAWWLAPAPAERLATMRALCGAFALVYLLVRANVLADFRGFPARDFAPVGVAQLFSAPLTPALVLALYVVTLVSGIAFTLGARFRVAGPVFAGTFLALTSYRNSWGMVFHTDNLLAVHLGVLALVPAADALARDARAASKPAADARYGWPLRLLCLLTTLCYALAGIAKLKLSGASWMHGEILRNYIAYDALRKAQVGSLYSPFGAWLVQHAWPFPLIGVLTLLLELGGPLALCNRKLSQLWVLGMYGFHLGVLATMAIAFPYPLAFVPFAAFYDCERLWQWPVLRRLRVLEAADPT